MQVCNFFIVIRDRDIWIREVNGYGLPGIWLLVGAGRFMFALGPGWVWGPLSLLSIEFYELFPCSRTSYEAWPCISASTMD